MKVAFWTVFSVGFVACSMWGIGPVLKRVGGDWMSAPMVLGIVLGLAIIALATMFATGVRPAPISTDVAMVQALAALVSVKVVVAVLTFSGVLGKA